MKCEDEDVDWIQMNQVRVQGGLWTRSWKVRFHKIREFLDQLRNYQLLEKESVPLTKLST